MFLTNSPRSSLYLSTATVALLVTACFSEGDPSADESAQTSSETETGSGDGDGDGDLSTGDGDGDLTTGDGDGDLTTGDGDGDPTPGDGDGDPSCTELGCACDPVDAGPCDEGLYCDETDMVCSAPACGNAELEPTEQCDDGNLDDGDGCDADCSFTEILAVEAGGNITCVLIEGGRVRCWGENGYGQLGRGYTQDVGDDELPNEQGDLLLPGPAVELSVDGEHVCALLDDASVRCWGRGTSGKLGYGLGINNVPNLGDDELLNDLDPVPVGGEVVELGTGRYHTCARLSNGKMRCWGFGQQGALGYGNQEWVGDDELPQDVGDVPVGAAVAHFTAGFTHTCALTVGNEVRCWGYGGMLGYANNVWVGAVNTPAEAGNVDFRPQGVSEDVEATQLAGGDEHTCALFETGEVTCWGRNGHGQLGQGDTEHIGDDETPAGLAPVSLPGAAIALSAGSFHTCALLDTDELVCWGRNDSGQLGYGNTENIGDDETPGNKLLFPDTIALVAAGENHTCALMQTTNELVCWGDNSSGQLGYGNTQTIGDDESPFALGAVSVF